MSSDQYSAAQTWFYRIILAPFPNMILSNLLRWMIRNPVAAPSDLNKVRPINNLDEMQRMTPKNEMKPSPFPDELGMKRTKLAGNRMDSIDEINANSVEELKSPVTAVPSMPVSPRLTHNKDGEAISDKKDQENPEPQKVTDNPKASKHLSKIKQNIFTKKFFGVLLSWGVALGSVYIIWAISVANSNQNSWPWGFWYVAALIFDQAIFNPTMTLLQFTLLHKYINSIKLSDNWKTAVRWIIGKDILAIVDSKSKLANCK